MLQTLVVLSLFIRNRIGQICATVQFIFVVFDLCIAIAIILENAFFVPTAGTLWSPNDSGKAACDGR